MLEQIVGGGKNKANYDGYSLNPLIVFEDLVDFTKKEGVYVARSNALRLNESRYDLLIKHYTSSFTVEGFYPIPVISVERDDDSVIFAKVIETFEKYPAPRIFIWAPKHNNPHLLDRKDKAIPFIYASYRKTTVKQVLENAGTHGQQLIDYVRTLIGTRQHA